MQGLVPDGQHDEVDGEVDRRRERHTGILIVTLTIMEEGGYRHSDDNNERGGTDGNDHEVPVRQLPEVGHDDARPARSGGQVRHAATAAGFWFNLRTAVLAEVPMGDRQRPWSSGRGPPTSRRSPSPRRCPTATDPARCAGRFEFDIDPVAGTWTSTPLEQVGALLTEVVQQSALARLAAMPVRAALAEGVVAVREAVEATLLADPGSATAGWQ